MPENDGSQDLTAGPTKARVSSVLNRNVKEFGAANLFDGNPDTCWNSGQGTPQWISLQFQRPVLPKTLQLMFQGGFVGKEVDVSVNEASSTNTSTSTSTSTSSSGKKAPLQIITTIYPDDDNTLQSFDLMPALTGKGPLLEMRLTFRDSTDFYGRVTLYQVAVLGRVVEGEEEGERPAKEEG